MLLGSIMLWQGVIGQVSAQLAAASLTGLVVVCRDAFAPVGEGSDQSTGLLEDVPSPGGGRPLVSMSLPVADVLVVVDGAGLASRTDHGGRFVLPGVPTDRPLHISVFQEPSGEPVAQVGDLVVSAGQTLDVGVLVLGGPAETPCAPAGP